MSDACILFFFVIILLDGEALTLSEGAVFFDAVALAYLSHGGVVLACDAVEGLALLHLVHLALSLGLAGVRALGGMLLSLGLRSGGGLLWVLPLLR